MLRRVMWAVLATTVVAPVMSAQVLTLTTPDTVWMRAIRQANFAFYARVVSLHATTTASVRAGPRTIVVKTIPLPDSALVRPAGFRPLGERRVTVVMRDTLLPRVGAELYLMTAGLASDSGLAVRELSRAESDRSHVSDITAKAKAAIRSTADSALASTLRAATGVWLARVDSVRPLPPVGGVGGERGYGLSGAVVNVSRSFAGSRPAGPGARMIVIAAGRLLGVRNPALAVGDVVIVAPTRVGAPFNASPVVAHATYVIVLPDQIIPATDSVRVKRFLP